MENISLNKNDIRGYELASFCEKGTILKHQGRPVFIIGSGAEFRDDFLAKLIEAYSQSDTNISPKAGEGLG